MSEQPSDVRWTAPMPLEAAAGWSWRLIAIALAVGVLFAGMSVLSVVVVPMVLAMFLTAVLAPLNAKLLEQKCKPALAAAICLLVLASGLGLVIWLFVSALVQPWEEISSQLSVVSGVTLLASTILLSLFVTFFYVKDGPLLWGAIVRQGGEGTARKWTGSDTSCGTSFVGS